MKVLYVGELTPGTTCFSRMNAMRDLGHDVTPVDKSATRPGRAGRLADRISRRLRSRPWQPRLNREVVAAAQATDSLELIWLDKPAAIHRRTLSTIRRLHPQAKVAAYLPDYLRNKDNWSQTLADAMPDYDAAFTTRQFEVDDLRELGCRRPYHINKSFGPELHRPVELSDTERKTLHAPVGFVGTYEAERAASIQALARSGVQVKVWGGLWASRLDKLHPAELGGPGELGETYVKRLCALDIALCFLRKANRDQQTSRSLEIPACGTFMLAERSPDHEALFKEDVEAVFFDTEEELIEKAKYYLAHPDEREQIAAAGRARCLSSGYSTHHTVRRMMDITCRITRGC